MLDVLLEQMQSPSFEIRIQAAQQLGESHSPEAFSPLNQMLFDDYPEVRRSVVLALGELGDLRAVSTLIELYHNDEFRFWTEKDELELRSSIRVALARFGSRAVEILFNHIEKSPVIEVLGDIGDKRAFEPLVGIIESDHNRFTRWEAIQSLVKLDDPRAVDVLIPLVRNKDVGVIAIQGLGLLGDARVFPLLAELIQRPDWMYYQLNEIAQALCRIDLERALDIMIPYVHENWIIPQRWLVLNTLEAIDHPRIDELFNQILRDPDDFHEWKRAVSYFWRTGRYDLLERLKSELPAKPAQVIQGFLEDMREQRQSAEQRANSENT